MASKLTFFILFAAVLFSIVSCSALLASAQEAAPSNDPAVAAAASATGSAAASGTAPVKTHEELETLLRASESGEKHTFQAEINKLLGIIINSLYTNKEIFLRELISNASDALDKIRFLALTSKDALKDAPEMEIMVSANEAEKTLTIRDFGIGMTRQELMQNLGTIAKSGTKSFLEKLQQGAAGGAAAADATPESSNNLIGQFGVGFYSAFLVADKVVVASKHGDDPDQWVWSSTADGSFTVVKDPRGNTLKRGTEITLFLKDNASKYAKAETLKNLIEKYSEFVAFPIKLWTTKTETKEVPAEETSKEEEEEKPAAAAAEEEQKDESSTDAEVKVEEEEKPSADKADEDKPKETKKITETKSEWELINKNKPIWTRRPSEVTKSEYESFYKIITKEFDEPMTYIHFRGEGNVDFKAILYIPGHPPYDMFDVQHRRASIRLYVKRVYITDQMDNMMPRYLNFIKGVVDSDDLPLNISRELLQNSKLMKLIQKKLVQKALAMIVKMAQADIIGRNQTASESDKPNTDAGEGELNPMMFQRFWKDYGKSIKLGIIEDQDNRQRLIKLLRFHSTKAEWFQTSLEEYIARMKPKQKYIYYVAGSNIEECRRSPYLEELRRRDIEVLYLTEAIDEYAIQNVPTYDGKELMSIARDGLELPEEDQDAIKKQEEQLNKQFEPLTKFMKGVLGERVHKVQAGFRLAESPMAVISPKYGFSANMLRVINAQTLTGQEQEQMAQMAGKLRLVEINPHHPIMKYLLQRVVLDNKDEMANNAVELLYQTGLMRSGFDIGDSAVFASRIFGITHHSLEHAPAPLTPEERQKVEAAKEAAEKEKKEAAGAASAAETSPRDEL